jgi:hypothetical protein
LKLHPSIFPEISFLGTHLAFSLEKALMRATDILLRTEGTAARNIKKRVCPLKPAISLSHQNDPLMTLNPGG